eukprot:944901-Prymnesium_polylepis.1
MPSFQRCRSAPARLQALSRRRRWLWRHFERLSLPQLHGERRHRASRLRGELIDRGGWMRLRQR